MIKQSRPINKLNPVTNTSRYMYVTASCCSAMRILCTFCNGLKHCVELHTLRHQVRRSKAKVLWSVEKLPMKRLSGHSNKSLPPSVNFQPEQPHPIKLVSHTTITLNQQTWLRHLNPCKLTIHALIKALNHPSQERILQLLAQSWSRSKKS